MAKDKTAKRHISIFYVVYFTLLILAAILIATACGYLRNLLAEYEAAQPKYLAEDVFDEYFSPIDYDRLLLDAQYQAGLADREEIQDYLTAQIAGEELTFSQGSSAQDDSVRYIVKAGSKLVGAINLKISDKVTEHGFPTYTLSSLELALNAASIPGGELIFRAPADYTVALDDTVLTEDLITSTYTDTEALSFYPAGVTGVEYVSYTVPGLTELPREVSVQSPAGDSAPFSYDEASHVYTADIAYSESLSDQYGTFVTQAMEGYAAYMQRVPGVNFRSIRDYFDPDSPLYSAIYAAGNDLWMVMKPDRNEFEDLVLEQFYPFSEDVFSCHISFTQVLFRGGARTPDVIDMVVFLRKTKDGFRIYEWHTASENS